MVAFVSNDRPWSSHLIPSHPANSWMYTREYVHLGGIFSKVHPQMSPEVVLKAHGNIIAILDGGFNYFLFSPLLGEDEPILTGIFQMG